jgi:PhnB protein
MAGVKPIPESYPRVCAYLHIDGAADAITFYQQAFGAVERLRMDDPEGKVGHAELVIGDSVVLLADQFLEMDVKGPKVLGGTPVVLSIYVEDIDATISRAVFLGAKITRPIEDKFYGDRVGQIEDPFGHAWSVQTHIEDVSPEEMMRRAQELALGG